MTSMKQFSHMSCKSHPLRAALYDELHIRPFHSITIPHQISHLAFRALKKEQGDAIGLLCELCRQYQIPLPDPGASGFLQDFGDFVLQWESHVEFYSITIMRSATVDGELFDQPAITQLSSDWLARQPGEIVAAFHLAVTDSQGAVEEEALHRHFEGHPISISEAAQGNATLYTAFRLHDDGFGRFIVQNQGMAGEQMGRLTRRLTEMETYRLFAMLAFPLAKQIAPQLVEMDQQLAQILSGLSGINSIEEERELLQQLSQQESRLEIWRSETNRRFSGARAYHEMIQDRLERITEKKVKCNPTLGDFMRRRLDPALRTCSSVHNMMEDLSTRIERASDLMRTRINLTLQEQNRTLLATMNRRSQLQFRLQETVEGLSVVAISYYLIGLIKYLFGGLPIAAWGLNKSILLACSIPVVLGAVLLVTKQIKHRLIKQPEQ